MNKQLDGSRIEQLLLKFPPTYIYSGIQEIIDDIDLENESFKTLNRNVLQNVFGGGKSIWFYNPDDIPFDDLLGQELTKVLFDELKGIDEYVDDYLGRIIFKYGEVCEKSVVIIHHDEYEMLYVADERKEL